MPLIDKLADMKKAIRRGSVHKLAALMSGTSPPELQDLLGHACLTTCRTAQILLLLVKFGADLNKPCVGDELCAGSVPSTLPTLLPLTYAARNGNVAAVRFLLAHNAKVDAQNKNTKATALHHAFRDADLAGNRTVMALLLEAGADPDARDKLGNRPDDNWMPSKIRSSIADLFADARAAKEAQSLRGGSIPTPKRTPPAL